MICQTCLRNRTQKEQTQLCDLKLRFRLPLNCTTRSPITNYSEIRCIELRVLQTSKGFGVFLFRQSFQGEGGVNANHNVTFSTSMAENDSRLLNSEGNRDGEWIFCRGKEADIALFLQVTRMRKIRKICEANLTSRLFRHIEFCKQNTAMLIVLREN